MIDENDEIEPRQEENNPEQGNNQMNVGNNNLYEEAVIFDDVDYLARKREKNGKEDFNAQENIKSNKQEKISMENKQDKNVQHQKLNKENQMNYQNKMAKKKFQNRNRQDMEHERKEKNINNENNIAEELFKKAIEKKANKKIPFIEMDNEGNTLSTKITEVLYDKFVGQNEQKSKHLDIYSKIKDEEIRQGREAKRTKDDAKKINNMIVRQEDYEKLKSDKKKGRQKEIKNKINEECAFIPNGKKNISSRNPNQFFNDQKKFIEKKEEIIHKMTKDILDQESKIANTTLISKNSEKIAISKNPNETRQDFCKRLAEEKLKNKREVIMAPKEEKRLTKQELKNLTEKLHKEGETFKFNREKMEKEQIDKMKKLEKNDFVLEKSKKVLFDKFITNYENILQDLFNRKDNFQINYDEYKNILNNLGFIKNNSTPNENLIKESFNNYLKPNEEKIDTYAFLIFALAALGIYKGNDEIIEEHSSKVTILKTEEEKAEENQGESQVENIEKKGINKNILKKHISNKNNTLKKNQNKTSSDLIKSVLPKLDLEKYGFPGKECKIIKNKFMPFVSGISEYWAKDLFKKKQERLDKIEEINKKNNLEESTKFEKNFKKEEEIIKSFRNKVLKKELFQDNEASMNEKDLNINTIKSFKVEDMYEILQKKKQRELDNLKAKQEEDFLQECTFQPNLKTKPVNKKDIAKNIEKLYLEGKESYMKKMQQEVKDLDLNDENEKNCTFKPVIKDYKGNYFENNPLKENKAFNTEIKKKEKIREEKGYNNKEIKKPMAFGIEPKSNKEEIYKRVIPNRAESLVGNIQNEFEDYSNFDDQGNINLLKIDVKLENNKTDLLVIYPDDDYFKIVDAFCNKNELGEEKRIRLIRVIKDKMREKEK